MHANHEDELLFILWIHYYLFGLIFEQETFLHDLIIVVENQKLLHPYNPCASPQGPACRPQNVILRQFTGCPIQTLGRASTAHIERLRQQILFNRLYSNFNPFPAATFLTLQHGGQRNLSSLSHQQFDASTPRRFNGQRG